MSIGSGSRSHCTCRPSIMRDERGCRVGHFLLVGVRPTPRPARRRSSPAGCGSGRWKYVVRGVPFGHRLAREHRVRLHDAAPVRVLSRRCRRCAAGTRAPRSARGPARRRPPRRRGTSASRRAGPPCCRSGAARPRGSCPPARRPRRARPCCSRGPEHVHRRLQHSLATSSRAPRALHAFGGGPAARVVSRCVHHGCSLPERLAAAIRCNAGWPTTLASRVQHS